MCRPHRIGLSFVALVLVVYVTAYAVLYERGTREAHETGFIFFFYCPVTDLRHGEDLPKQHCFYLELFDPINTFHRATIGGKEPCRGLTWGLSR